MTVEIVEVSSIVLDEKAGVWRQAPRPKHQQDDDYRSKFDYSTLFYDVFENGSSIVLSGPPLFNLAESLKAENILLDNTPLRADKLLLGKLDRTQRSAITTNGKALSLQIADFSKQVKVQPSYVDYFAGKKVLVTKSKNNKIQWIKDWIRFYITIHQIDGVLLYDNNSDHYNIEELAQELSDFTDIAICLVPWNFPFGPQGGGWGGKGVVPWDSDFCEYGILEHAKYRFLQQAELVISVDIDELIVVENQLPLHRWMKQQRQSVVSFCGHWIEALTVKAAEPPNFTDFLCFDPTRSKTTAKWALCPQEIDLNLQWRTHNIVGLDMPFTEQVKHRHFMAINTNWKFKRDKLIHRPGKLQPDFALLEAFNKVWPDRKVTHDASYLIWNLQYSPELREQFKIFIQKVWCFKTTTVVFDFNIAGCFFAFDVVFNLKNATYLLKLQARNSHAEKVLEQALSKRPLPGNPAAFEYHSPIIDQAELQNRLVWLYQHLVTAITAEATGYQQKPVFSDSDSYSHYFHNALLYKLAHTDSVKLGFVLNDLTKWNAGSLLAEFKKHPKFKLTIFVALSGRETRAEQRRQEIAQLTAFFSSSDLSIVSLYNPETDRQRAIQADEADILFLQQPWGLEWLVNRVKAQQLLAYMPYGYLIYQNNQMEYQRPNFHPYLWRYFSQSENHKKLHLETEPAAANQVVVTGYPKLDIYQNTGTPVFDWPVQDRAIKVIYAPHHALPKETLRIGTFHWNHQLILDFARQNPQTQWVYRPHGRLKYVVESNKVMSQAEYEQYERDWQSLPNATVYRTGEYFDLFQTSDVLITDCSSFLGEYLPTGKPVIWLVADKPAFELNEVGKLITDNYYQARNPQQLTELFRCIVLGKEDELYQARQTVKTRLFSDGFKASAAVVSHVLLQIEQARSGPGTLNSFVTNSTSSANQVLRWLESGSAFTKYALSYLSQYHFPAADSVNFSAFNANANFGTSTDTGLILRPESAISQLKLQLTTLKPEYLSLDGIVFIKAGQPLNIKELVYQVQQSSIYKNRQPDYLLQGSRIHTQAESLPWWEITFDTPLDCDEIIVINRNDIYAKRNNSLAAILTYADGSKAIQYADCREKSLAQLLPGNPQLWQLVCIVSFMLYHNLAKPDAALLQQLLNQLQQDGAYDVDSCLLLIAAHLSLELSATGLPISAFAPYQSILTSATRLDKVMFYINHFASMQGLGQFSLNAQGITPIHEAVQTAGQENDDMAQPGNSVAVLQPSYINWPWPLQNDSIARFQYQPRRTALAGYAQAAGAGYMAANTLQAIENALPLSGRGIELDIVVTKDQQFVLHNGYWLNQEIMTPPEMLQHSLRWPTLDQLTLRELASFNFSRLPLQSQHRFYYPEYFSQDGLAIPTLAAALTLLNHHSKPDYQVLLDLHLPPQCSFNDSCQLADKLVQTVQASSLQLQCVIITDNWQLAAYIRQQQHSMQVWLSLPAAGWLNASWLNGSEPLLPAAALTQLQTTWQQPAYWPTGQRAASAMELLQNAASCNADVLVLPISYYPVLQQLNTPLPLPVFWLGGNERNLQRLQAVAATGIGLAHYAPGLRLELMRDEEQRLVEKAKDWFRAEKWQEAVVNLQQYLEQQAGDCHFDIYYRLAIALRKLNAFAESETVLQSALKVHPNNYRAYIELAALENIRCNWPQALVYWRRAYQLAEDFSATSYQRFARAVVVQGEVDPFYTRMFERGMLIAAYERIFSVCYYYYQILQMIKAGKIVDAIGQLTPLADSALFSGIGIPHLYLTRQLQLQQQHSVLTQQLLADRQGFDRYMPTEKPTRLMPYDIANLNFVLTELSNVTSPAATELKQLTSLLQPVVSHARQAPFNLCQPTALEDTGLQQAIVPLAAFFRHMTLPATVLPSRAWFILADIMLLGFQFEAYGLLRRLAIAARRSAVANNTENSDISESAFYPDTAIAKAAALADSAESVVKLLPFGGKQAFQQLFQPLADSNFAAYLQGKRIALVGPVQPDTDQGAEIDSFDIVIRLNFRGLAQLSGKGAGSKTHISYYANDLIDGDNTTPDILEGISQLDWVVFDTETNLANNVQIRQARMHFPYRQYNPLAKGVVNAIQKVLLDLMLYNPAAIKVFNTNLWLSQRSIPGYHLGRERNEVSRFIWHDPLANFIFLQGLWQNGDISADAALSKVLSLTPDSYIARLHQAYCPAVQQG